MRTRWRAFLATSILAAVGIAGALVVGEIAVRLYEGDPLLPLVPPEPYVDNGVLYRRSPTRLYELRPGVEQVVGANRVRIRINDAGFRDDVDYPEAKPPGTLRIVILGDSFTFAGKVDLPGTMAKVLEQEVRSRSARRCEVLNLAVPGYNTEQEAVSLEEVGLRYQPDIVVVAFVLNDALAAGQLVPTNARLPAPVRRVLKRSYLVQFLYAHEKQIRSEWKKGRFKGASELRDLHPGTAGYARMRSALERIHTVAAEHGVRLMVAVWPLFERLGAYPFEDEHALVTKTATDLGIPVLDLLPAFRGRDETALWVARNDHHPATEAQRVAGEAIYADLKARGWLGP